jgi:hypothetical protein
MGSRQTHEAREARLLEAGLTSGELERLSSPIGLDLGARTPQETAIFIAAEMIAMTRGGSGRRLRAIEGNIHHHHQQAGPSASPGPLQRDPDLIHEVDASAGMVRRVPDARCREIESFKVVERLRRAKATVERYADTSSGDSLHRDDLDVLLHLLAEETRAPVPAAELQHTLGLTSGSLSPRLTSLKLLPSENSRHLTDPQITGFGKGLARLGRHP